MIERAVLKQVKCSMQAVVGEVINKLGSHKQLSSQVTDEGMCDINNYKGDRSAQGRKRSRL